MAATRRVNVRFLGMLVGTLAVLGPSVYFVNAYQVRRNSIALKHRANQAFDDSRYAEAAKFYWLYLKQHPDDIEAGAFLLPFHTTYLALHTRAKLRAGETLLVVGGASSLGPFSS